jgi:hypothetical protein
LLIDYLFPRHQHDLPLLSFMVITTTSRILLSILKNLSLPFHCFSGGINGVRLSAGAILLSVRPRVTGFAWPFCMADPFTFSRHRRTIIVSSSSARLSFFALSCRPGSDANAGVWVIRALRWTNHHSVSCGSGYF